MLTGFRVVSCTLMEGESDCNMHFTEIRKGIQ
jgi:hypothetical protein